MIKFLSIFFMMFLCVDGFAADAVVGKKYIFNSRKLESELISDKSTFGSASSLLSGIDSSETETINMRKWFKNWLLKQDSLRWEPVRAVMEHGGFAVVDEDVLNKYLSVSCFDGNGDTGWDELIKYATPYLDDNFHFHLSVKLARENDYDKTTCVFGKIAKYMNYSTVGIYRDTATDYSATNVLKFFDELDKEINNTNK